MLTRTLVIAPHPDDEVIGCGGTLLRRKADGSQLGWLIVTGVSQESGAPADQVRQCEAQIAELARLIGFDQVYPLRLPPARLDTLPLAELVERFARIFHDFQPGEVLLPHRSDVHTDHRVVFDAAAACTKWFRHPFVRRVLAYETTSETDFSLRDAERFRPNYFVDISVFLDRKLQALAVYQSELGSFPFPRSIEAVRATAAVRGASSGFRAAEAFQLLRERQ